MTTEQKSYEAVIFDLDGTLLNTLEDLCDSVNAALRFHRLPVRNLEEIRHFVGNGVEKLVQRSVPTGTTPDQTASVFTYFKSYYEEHCNEKTRLYDGITELLRELKARGIKTAIHSNKLQEGVTILYEQYFKEDLTVAFGARDGIPKKPAPDAVYEIAKELSVDLNRIVYVGDSDVDVETAANAGIDCISVTWGFRTREELQDAGAKVFASTAEELLAVIVGVH